MALTEALAVLAKTFPEEVHVDISSMESSVAGEIDRFRENYPDYKIRLLDQLANKLNLPAEHVGNKKIKSLSIQSQTTDVILFFAFYQFQGNEGTYDAHARNKRAPGMIVGSDPAGFYIFPVAKVDERRCSLSPENFAEELELVLQNLSADDTTHLIRQLENANQKVLKQLDVILSLDDVYAKDIEQEVKDVVQFYQFVKNISQESLEENSEGKSAIQAIKSEWSEKLTRKLVNNIAKLETENFYSIIVEKSTWRKFRGKVSSADSPENNKRLLARTLLLLEKVDEPEQKAKAWHAVMTNLQAQPTKEFQELLRYLANYYVIPSALQRKGVEGLIDQKQLSTLYNYIGLYTSFCQKYLTNILAGQQLVHVVNVPAFKAALLYLYENNYDKFTELFEKYFTEPADDFGKAIHAVIEEALPKLTLEERAQVTSSAVYPPLVGDTTPRPAGKDELSTLQNNFARWVLFGKEGDIALPDVTKETPITTEFRKRILSIRYFAAVLQQLDVNDRQVLGNSAFKNPKTGIHKWFFAEIRAAFNAAQPSSTKEATEKLELDGSKEITPTGALVEFFKEEADKTSKKGRRKTVSAASMHFGTWAESLKRECEERTQIVGAVLNQFFKDRVPVLDTLVAKRLIQKNVFREALSEELKSNAAIRVQFVKTVFEYLTKVEVTLDSVLENMGGISRDQFLWALISVGISQEPKPYGLGQAPTEEHPGLGLFETEYVDARKKNKSEIVLALYCLDEPLSLEAVRANTTETAKLFFADELSKSVLGKSEEYFDSIFSDKKAFSNDQREILAKKLFVYSMLFDAEGKSLFKRDEKSAEIRIRSDKAKIDKFTAYVTSLISSSDTVGWMDQLSLAYAQTSQRGTIKPQTKYDIAMLQGLGRIGEPASPSSTPGGPSVAVSAPRPRSETKGKA